MSYIPTQWQTGDIVTADKLNKIENAVANGGGGGILILELTAVQDGYDIGASFNDLKDAFMSGKKIITHIEFEEDGVDGDAWSNLNIIELLEGETSEGSIYFINFTCYINSVDFHFMHTVDDPTADIIVAALH